MESKTQLFEELTKNVNEIVEKPTKRDTKLEGICTVLKKEVPHYDWVGFYFVTDAGQELILGPFAGAATEHDRIEFGEGVCGRAAEGRKVITVQDVTEAENYLSCSPAVQAEIVIPVFKAGEIKGVLDVDSHSLSPFTKEDRRFLMEVCEIVSEVF